MKRPEQNRVARLKRLMKSEGVDSLLVTRREDVRYLTGFTGSSGSALVGRGRPCLITDFRYKLQAARETAGVDLYIQKKDFPTALEEVSQSAAADLIWFDESSVTIEGLKKLRKQGLSLRAHRDLVGDLRQRKDERELKHIALAIRRAEESFRELKRHIRPGARECDLALTLEFLMRGKGARKPAFDTIIASGANAAMPHATVTGRRIRRGDLVTFDFGSEADGYFSDITRTYCIGTPSPQQREIHALVLSAQTSAIKKVRADVSCKSVDAAARGTIQKGGHGKNFGHGTGHGVGLMVHEKPTVSPLSKDRVEQDMVFTVEPGVYVPGWGGVRIEDMILVTGNGAKVLTTLPRELEGLRSL